MVWEYELLIECLRDITILSTCTHIHIELETIIGGVLGTFLSKR